MTASHNENGWTGIKLADGLSSTLGPEGIIKFKGIVSMSEITDAKASLKKISSTLSEIEAKKEDSLPKLKARNVPVSKANSLANLVTLPS